MGIERIGLGHELLSLASEMAIKWSISGYDAIYASTAQLINGQWLTFDLAAAKKIQNKQIVIGLK